MGYVHMASACQGKVFLSWELGRRTWRGGRTALRHSLISGLCHRTNSISQGGCFHAQSQEATEMKRTKVIR